MLRIREAIVVEGRYDKNTLSQVVDTLILPQLLLHLGRVLGAVGEPQQAGDSDAVGVGHHHAGGVVHVPQNQVGGLPAHSGWRLGAFKFSRTRKKWPSSKERPAAGGWSSSPTPTGRGFLL